MHIISIYPQYVNAILDGQKLVECRKSALGLVRGDLLQLYATAPVKAILCQARVLDVHRGAPEELWEQFEHRTCVKKDDYFAYYAGKKEAVLLALTAVQRHAAPVLLDHLRGIEPRFSPPQTARRLSEALQALCTATR
jgi:predicted transcriptional regulator